jgi:exodeoxyribonuclease-3
VKVVSWNVNSIKARDVRLFSWLERHRPDVVCLQELKVTDDNFPYATLAEAGYHAVANCQRAYNGVAILSRTPLEEASRDLQDDVDDGQARLVAATALGVRVICVYVPNGSTRTSEKYPYKLAWMKRLRRYLEKRHTTQTPLVLCGDFNVAPSPSDVAKPDQWESSVLFHPEVREHLQHITSWGLVDVFRKHHPAGGVYSWWDYRMLGFVKNNGLRIDQIYATDALACRSTGASIDREERKGQLPSDHAPVIADFAWP